MDQAIADFLTERKEIRLKGKLKAAMSEEEINTVNQEAEAEFALENWLPEAAKRAGQLSLVSHPSKFSHPSSKTSMIIAEGKKANDGLLRSGNVSADLDVLGNAAALDVFKFLSLTLGDGQTVLEHLNQGTDYIKNELSVSTATFAELSAGFLNIQKQDTKQATHGKVKQVYFPAGGDYHLLSILTPSGLMYDLTARIKNMRFSEEAKAARDARRKQAAHQEGYDELFGLAVIGYGGTKPQNISVLNSQNGGKAFLVPCMPPQLEKRNIRLPKSSFFSETLWASNYSDSFQSLHRLFAADINNINLRKGRDKWILFIVNQVMKKVWDIRGEKNGWSHTETYINLPLHQKIWLDNHYLEDRENTDAWVNDIVPEFARWLINAYKRNVGNQAKMLLDDELRRFQTLIKENEDALR